MLNLDTKLTLDQKVAEAVNLAERFSADDRERIAACVWHGYEADLASRSAWEERTQAAMDLALQVSEEKTYPWQGASNVAFPLVTIAAMQFHSRAYPTLMQGAQPVKARVVGEDADGLKAARAARVSTHMSYQVLEEDSTWEEQHDRLLINLPIVGCAFKKSYHDGERGHNVSELVLARDFVLDYYAKSVDDCARKTHVIPRYRNELYSKMATGVFVDCRDEPWFKGAAVPHVPMSQREVDDRQGVEPPQPDQHTPFTTLEQHVLLDLDKDGYFEPYIVTIEAETKTLLRLVARWSDDSKVRRNRKGEVVLIEREEYFTRYELMPAPDGGIYGLGFGILLGPLNESVNTLINVIIDSGHMHAVGGGFLGKGAKVRGGDYSFRPNEWKRVDSSGDDLNKSIVQLPTNEPSAVLFNLLTLLINYTERISGATDMLVGENPGQNTPAENARIMVEQGMKIYAAVFKRVWRCMREEFRKLFILNGAFMPAKTVYGVDGAFAFREDYLIDPACVRPAADPNTVSDNARIQKAITVKQSAQQTPGYDTDAVEVNLLSAMGVENISTLFPGTKALPPGKSEKVQIEEMKQAQAQAQMQLEWTMFQLEMAETKRMNSAEIMKIMMEVQKLKLEAKGQDNEMKIATLNAQMEARALHNDMITKQMDAMTARMDNILKAKEIQLKDKELQIKEEEVKQAPELARLEIEKAKASAKAAAAKPATSKK